MIKFLNILTYLSGALATVCWALLSIGLANTEWIEWETLRTLVDKEKWDLFITALIATGIFAGAQIWNAALKPAHSLEQIPGPRGEQTQKATLTGFKKEVKEAAAEAAKEAEGYFSAAERDFKARHYKEAAENYQKSINALPTMSAYLNLGISLFNISDFPKAENAWTSGLRIARKKGNKRLEAAFLGNMGIVYSNQGKVDEALKSFQQALEIDKRIGNPLGQANQLGNIGIVYSNQGKLDEALKSHQAALKIHKRIGNPLGQAQNLGNIGIVYFAQGKLDEALKSHQAALKIHKRIGNPLGQAQDLGNIGIVYAEQGKKRDALDLLNQARDIYLKIGAKGQGLRIIEAKIAKLTAD